MWDGGITDHLGQIGYAEMCSLVTKCTSKLNKIQITNYMPCILLRLSDTCIIGLHSVGLVERRPVQNQINPFIPFDRTPTCDRQTDRQTDTYTGS